MINFYLYYNGELDNQHYAPCIAQVIRYNFTSELKPIEHIIKKIPWYAYHYAKDVIKVRWKEAEPYIMKSVYIAYNYAKSVIGGRWPEAEPYIMTDGYNAYRYAKNIIGGRWPEAEPYIMEDLTWWWQYCGYFNL